MKKVDVQFLEVCNRVVEDLLEIRRRSKKYLGENEQILLATYLDMARIGVERLKRGVKK